MKVLSHLARFMPVAALLWAAPPVLAQETTRPAPPAAHVAPAPAPMHPALWRVADADTTIYLFGTIHVLPQDSTWFAGPLAQAVDSSDELVTEIGQVDPQEVTRAVVDLGLLPPGQSLRGQMSAEDRIALEGALTELGAPLDALDRAKPWFAANSLLLMRLGKAGISGANGPEGHLNERFAARARPRIPLETIQYQLELYDALPQALQQRFLRDVIDAKQDIISEFNRIADEWGAGDATDLAAAMRDSDEPQIIQHLLLDRNRVWSQWIKARLERPGTVFIAVGAGHLGGAGSVLDELALLGITATRVQ